MDIYSQSPQFSDSRGLAAPAGCGMASFACADSSEFDVPTASIAKPAGHLCWALMLRDLNDVTSGLVGLLDEETVEAFVKAHPYLDICDAVFLLQQPPCQIRRLAEEGQIPAHGLKHEGQTCWKFRLGELLDWAAENGVEISPKALSDLLSLGDEPQ